MGGHGAGCDAQSTHTVAAKAQRNVAVRVQEHGAARDVEISDGRNGLADINATATDSPAHPEQAIAQVDNTHAAGFSAQQPGRTVMHPRPTGDHHCPRSIAFVRQAC